MRNRLTLSRWKGTSASFAGRGHLERGLLCQDASSVSLDGVARIIVVSDGAGSARHAEHGAIGAVEATIRTLRTTAPWNEPEEIRERILAACKMEIAERASALSCNESDLAATLVFVAVAQGVFVAGNLGDGVVAAFRGQRPKVLLAPVRGEFANETIFLTSRKVSEYFRIVRKPLDDYDGFAVMSDGAAESFYQRSNDSLAPALPHVLCWFEQETSNNVHNAIRESVMPMIVNRTMDDCSLAVLKLVQIDLDTLAGKTGAFRMEFLGTKNKRGLQNRLRILKHHQEDTHESEIAEVTGLSVRTIRNHRRILKSLIS